MTDLIEGRQSLNDKGLVACGGFSYGDVLGAGGGWAKTILHNPRLAEMFVEFFSRDDSFALGVCNGCQMMSHLRALIPGARHWPRFERNASEQYEGRLIQVVIPESPSLFFAGMAGSHAPIANAHGEGRAVFDGDQHQREAIVALRYIDSRRRATDAYPYNPNGSPEGICALTTVDGRFTIVMPHPERVFRTVQMSWQPPRARRRLAVDAHLSQCPAVGRLAPRSARHGSALTPAVVMTFAHFAISSLRNFCACSGEPPPGSMPSCSNRPFRSGEPIAFADSAERRLTISRGVPRRAKTSPTSTIRWRGRPIPQWSALPARR